jgi:hypothetical protein
MAIYLVCLIKLQLVRCSEGKPSYSNVISDFVIRNEKLCYPEAGLAKMYKA